MDNNSLTAAHTYLPSTLLPSTECYRTKYYVNSWRLYLFPYAYQRTDCCRGGVRTVQQKLLTS